MKLFLIVHLSSAIFHLAEACLLRLVAEEQQVFWDDVKSTSPRNFADGCDCGQRPNLDLPWNLFVHAEKVIDSRTGEGTVCTGTIIASNLVITSHKCLTHLNHTMNLYDSWKPTGGKANVEYSPSQIKVTEHFDIKNPGQVFIVENIIYSAEYAYSTSFNKSFLNGTHDLAMLKVAADFTLASSKFKPICIPDERFAKINPVGKVAIFYGAGTRKDYPIRTDQSWNPERKVAIQDQGMLCLRQRERGVNCGPNNFGSPLIVSPGKSSFLLGISSKIVTDPENEIELMCFDYLLHLFKYIEHEARVHGSKFCKSPDTTKVDLAEQDFPVTHDLFPLGSWPPFSSHYWEDPAFSKKRDETLECTCGLGNPGGIGRIVGGEEAVPHEFPWMALLVNIDISGHGHQCGGSIINDRFILTAAHCVIDHERLRKGFLDVVTHTIILALGAHDLVYLKQHGTSEQVHRVKSVIIHPDFESSFREQCYSGIGDIALLELLEPLKFSNSDNSLRPICLPRRGADLDLVGKTATVAGWGRTDFENDSSQSDTLRKVEATIQDIKMCTKVSFGRYPEDHLCPDKLPMICLLVEQKSAGPGDSGGPLKIYENGTKQWTQVGIVHGGYCGYDEDDSEKESCKVKERWEKGEIKKGEIVKESKKMLDLKDCGSATVAFYENVLKYLDFIEFHSSIVGAKYCK